MLPPEHLAERLRSQGFVFFDARTDASGQNWCFSRRCGRLRQLIVVHDETSRVSLAATTGRQRAELYCTLVRDGATPLMLLETRDSASGWVERVLQSADEYLLQCQTSGAESFV